MAQTAASKILLNYSMSLSDMLTACKHVGEVHPSSAEMVTEEYFPVKGQGEVAMPLLEKLWTRTGAIGPVLARAMLSEKGLRPATLPEILMLMANNPEEVTEHAVVALSPVTITPIGRLKAWYGEYKRSFVPTIINCTRYHNGGWLERAGKPEIWLSPEHYSWFGGNNSVDWHFAAVPK